jgi:hypothetical protein
MVKKGEGESHREQILKKGVIYGFANEGFIACGNVSKAAKHLLEV